MAPMDDIWQFSPIAVMMVLAKSAIKYLKWWAIWLAINSIVGE